MSDIPPRLPEESIFNPLDQSGKTPQQTPSSISTPPGIPAPPKATLPAITPPPLTPKPSAAPTATPPSIPLPPGPAAKGRRAPVSRPAKRAAGGPPLWAIILIMLGGVLVLAGVIWIATTSLPAARKPESGAEALHVGKLTTFDSPPTAPAQPVIRENDTPVLTVLPNAINVAGSAFPVVPVTPEQGRWPIPIEGRNVAVWVYGTVINYVVGLPYTSSTESLLGGLAGSQRITLTLDNGSELVFGAPQTQRVAAETLTPLEQSAPGLTLILLGGTQADRLVVRARYLPEESVAARDEQRIGALTVQVLETHVVKELDEYRYLVVEYRATNNGATPVSAGFFDPFLLDSGEQRYQLHSEATSLGDHGPLKVDIPAGISMEGSAGYMIPNAIKPPLTWVFRADPTAAESAAYIVAYKPREPLPPQPVAELKSAFVDRQRNVIVINGSVRNAGEQPLTVTLDSLNLTSTAGKSSMQTASPPLPWNVEGGQTLEFEIQFSLPQDAQSMLLDILGFTFQLQ